MDIAEELRRSGALVRVRSNGKDPTGSRKIPAVTKPYRDWLEKRHRNGRNGVNGNGHTRPTEESVDFILGMVTALVGDLLEAGVPKEVALSFLPHALYQPLMKKRPKKKTVKRKN